MDIAFEQKIRRRAYEIWVAAGMGEGDAERHWLHAERAIRHEAEVPTAEPDAEQVAKPVSAKKAGVPAAKTAAESKPATIKLAATKAAKAKATKAAAPRRTKTVASGKTAEAMA